MISQYVIRFDFADLALVIHRCRAAQIRIIVRFLQYA